MLNKHLKIRPKTILLPMIALIAIAWLPLYAQAATPVLVKDLNNFGDAKSSHPGDFTYYSGMVYFAASDETGDRELWVTDGTETGTQLFANLNANQSSSPAYLTVSNGYLYFRATATTSLGIGTELWKSDGTAAGTEVLDVIPGTAYCYPTYLTDVGGTLYFSGNDDTHGRELWKSDGTVAGTVVVADIVPGTGSSSPEKLENVNGVLYFVANDGTNGKELWKYNPATNLATLVKNIHPASGSDPDYLKNVNGTLFFSADDGSGIGKELWKSDGTMAGTVLVKDIHPSGSSSPEYLEHLNGEVFFKAYTLGYQAELWKSDGTAAGTVRVKDINPSGAGSPRYLKTVNGILYFYAADDYVDFELWKSDGTEAGTVRVKDICPGDFGSRPADLADCNGTLYLSANDGPSGWEPFKSNGTAAGTILIKNIIPGTAGAAPKGAVRLNDKYILATNWPNTYAYNGLWASYGTSGGTLKLDFVNDLYSATRLTSIGNRVLFAAGDADNYLYGVELWRTDGTPSGTYMVKDILPGSGTSSLQSFHGLDGKLYFNAKETFSGAYEAWVSDGTSGGTYKLLSSGGLPLANAYRFGELNGLVYFGASDGTQTGIWRTNGTQAGTIFLTDTVFPQAAMVTSGNYIYFRGDNSPAGMNDRELWRTDGTVAGTIKVKDINTSSTANSSSDPEFLTDVNGTLFFAAKDGIRLDLWKSDGTEAGTVLVKDTSSTNPFGCYPEKLINVNGLLFFVGYESSSTSKELWRSDGTATGTYMVKDIWPGSPESFIDNMSAANGRLYFQAHDGVHGLELWQSDGTAAGTFMVADLNPGTASSSPNFAVGVNDMLLFMADDGFHGEELFKITMDPPPTPTHTFTPTLTPTPTITPTYTITPTFTVTPTPVIAAFPFFDGFESGGLEPYWTTDSLLFGRIQVTSLSLPADGQYHVLMDSYQNNLQPSLNEMILSINLSGASNPILKFSLRSFNDEPHPMLNIFSGSYAGDGVSISEDGQIWHTIFSANNPLPSMYLEYEFNLEPYLATFADRSHIRIKFQQYDNVSIPGDGYGWDNVALLAATPTVTLTPIPTDTPTPTITPVDCPGLGEMGTGDYTIDNITGLYGTKFVSCRTWVVNYMNLYIQDAKSGAGRVAIYADDGAGEPGVLLAESNSQNLTNGWNGFYIPETSVTLGATYWLYVQTSRSDTQLRMKYDSDSGRTKSRHPYTYSVFPDPLGTTTRDDPYILSIYAEYVQPPTQTPTLTPVPADTLTPLPTETNTPLPTETNTPLPTETNTPLPTETNTPLPTETNTPLPTETNTPLPTETNTPLPTETNTPLPTETNTPLPTETNTPLPTETNTPLPTETNTPLPTETNTPLPTETNTPLPTETNTPESTATFTPTQGITVSATPTPKRPQRVWAWIDGCFILKPGDSRDIKALSLRRWRPQPNITLRYKVMKGSGTFNGDKVTYAITGPNAEPAVATFTASNKKFDVNIVRVDNLGLGGRKYLLLLVHKKGCHHCHKGKGKKKGPKWHVNMPKCFDSEDEAKAAAAEVEGAFQVGTPVPTPETPSPTPIATATEIPTVEATAVIPTSTVTALPTATPFVEAKTVLAYPNPARGQVNFAYTVSGAAKISIDIYQLTGERVASIVEHLNGGGQTLTTSWQAAGVAPGIYLVRIVITDSSGKVVLSQKKKVALVR